MSKNFCAWKKICTNIFNLYLISYLTKFKERDSAGRILHLSYRSWKFKSLKLKVNTWVPTNYTSVYQGPQSSIGPDIKLLIQVLLVFWCKDLLSFTWYYIQTNTAERYWKKFNYLFKDYFRFPLWPLHCTGLNLFIISWINACWYQGFLRYRLE